MLIGSGVHLGYGNLVLKWSEFLGKLFVDWLKSLAVSTPRSIGFKKNKLSTAQNSLLEIVSNNNENWLVIFGWNFGWLIEWLFDTWFYVLESLLQSLDTHVLNSVLIKIVSNKSDQHCLVALADAQIIRQLLAKSLGDFWQRENNLASFLNLLLGKDLEILNVLGAEVIIKEKQGLQFLTEDSVSRLLIKLRNQRIFVSIDELNHDIKIELFFEVQNLDSVVEVSEQNQSLLMLDFLLEQRLVY